MRLLFLDFSLPYLLADEEFPVGGWAVQLEQWLNGLSENDVHAGVLTSKGANALVGRETPYELIETIDLSAGIRVLKYFYSYIPSLLAAARTFRPDAIVQSCASFYTGILAHIARRLDVPFVYRVASDMEVDSRISSSSARYERIAYRYGLRNADLVICQNGYQQTHIGQAWPGKRLLHIQNCIRIPDAVASVRTRNERDYVAWVGVFRKEKNLPLLVRLARRLPEIEFRVAGMPHAGTDAGTLSAMDELHSLPNVVMTGYLKRTAVPAFLDHAVALLCTSDFEGFSNTFLEAFAAGTPVVTRKEVDPDGLVKRRDLGFAAANEEDLAKGLGAFASMPANDFDALAAKCRAYVVTNHGPAAAMQPLIQAVQTLIESRKAL